MNIELRRELPSMRDQVSAEEWRVRVDLAACYRLVEYTRMADTTNTHISARIPGTEHILINPLGWMFDEITASSLVRIDLDGNILEKAADDLTINHAGFVIHSAVHGARPDVGCVLHTHTRAGGAVSALKCGLLPLSQKALRFYSRIAYHDYWGPAVDLEERQALASDLGSANAMILRNHGLLTCAPTIAEAFNMMLSLDRACQIQVDAMASGHELVVPPEAVIRETDRLFDPKVRRPYGVLEWPAMLRLVARKGRDFAD